MESGVQGLGSRALDLMCLSRVRVQVHQVHQVTSSGGFTHPIAASSVTHYRDRKHRPAFERVHHCIFLAQGSEHEGRDPCIHGNGFSIRVEAASIPVIILDHNACLMIHVWAWLRAAATFTASFTASGDQVPDLKANS